MTSIDAYAWDALDDGLDPSDLEIDDMRCATACYWRPAALRADVQRMLQLQYAVSGDYQLVLLTSHDNALSMYTFNIIFIPVTCTFK